MVCVRRKKKRKVNVTTVHLLACACVLFAHPQASNVTFREGAGMQLAVQRSGTITLPAMTKGHFAATI